MISSPHAMSSLSLVMITYLSTRYFLEDLSLATIVIKSKAMKKNTRDGLVWYGEWIGW